MSSTSYFPPYFAFGLLLLISSTNLLQAQNGPIPGGCLFVGPNLVINPEFEEGNIGFGSSFLWRDEYTCYWGDYTVARTIVNDPATTCYDAPNFNLQSIWAVTDRNDPGNGKFMIVDPCDPLTQSPSDSCSATNPDGTVWSQTIPVCPQSEYTFSVFAKNIYFTEAIQYPGASQNPDFELTINGDTVSGYYVDGVLSLDGSYELGQQAEADSGVWVQISGRWESHSNTTATLVMKNLVEGSQGNDLAVDGVFFGLCEEDLSVDIAGSLTQCISQGYSSVTLTPTANTMSTGWLYHEWYKDNVLVYSDDNPPSSLSITADPGGNHLGEYRLAAYKDPLGIGCAYESAAILLTEDCGSFPVEWLGFEAAPNGKQVQLNWETAQETNNQGFFVEMETASSDNFASLGFVESQGNSLAPQSYDFLTNDLPAGVYQFRLRQVDLNGDTDLSAQLSVTIEQQAVYLGEAYPNPMQESGILPIEVAEKQWVRVSLYTSLGQTAKEVFSDVLQPGETHEISIPTADLSAGIYLLSIQGASFRETQRIVVKK